METFTPGPMLALVALTVAAGLIVLEAAVPTFGIAGLLGTLAGGLAVWAVVEADKPWWSLLLVIVAIILWVILVAIHRRSTPLELTAVGLYAAGGVGYGIAAGDLSTIFIAILGAVGLAWAFPYAHRWTRGLVEAPSAMGMEAMVGRVGVIENVSGETLSVRIDGSLWNAQSALCPDGSQLPPPQVGFRVVIISSSGSELVVEPVATARPTNTFSYNQP